MLTINTNSKMNHHDRIIEIWTGIVCGLIGGGYKVIQIELLQVAYNLVFWEKLSQVALTAIVTGLGGAFGAWLFAKFKSHIKSVKDGKANKEKSDKTKTEKTKKVG